MITDAQVEAALEAWFTQDGHKTRWREHQPGIIRLWKKQMRAALEAAFFASARETAETTNATDAVRLTYRREVAQL